MIAEFIAYLQGAGLTPDVQYAFTSEPVEEYSNELPIILVYPSGTSAQPSVADNRIVQPTFEEVTCLLGCAIADLETHRDALRAAVLGWVMPASTFDAMELTGGDVLGIRGGSIWWTETYSAAVRLYQS